MSIGKGLPDSIDKTADIVLFGLGDDAMSQTTHPAAAIRQGLHGCNIILEMAAKGSFFKTEQ